MLKLIIKRIVPLSEREMKGLCDTLSADAAERLGRKKNAKLHTASACALSLLTDKERASLAYREDGRPYLCGGECEISVSHSESYAVVALCDGAVGVDVEDTERAREINDRLFSENEMSEIESGTPRTEIWTRKEALFKYLARDNEGAKYSPISLDSSDAERYGAYIQTIAADGATVSVCTAHNETIEILIKDE